MPEEENNSDFIFHSIVNSVWVSGLNQSTFSQSTVKYATEKNWTTADLQTVTMISSSMTSFSTMEKRLVLSNQHFVYVPPR